MPRYCLDFQILADRPITYRFIKTRFELYSPNLQTKTITLAMLHCISRVYLGYASAWCSAPCSSLESEQVETWRNANPPCLHVLLSKEERGALGWDPTWTGSCTTKHCFYLCKIWAAASSCSTAAWYSSAKSRRNPYGFKTS